MQQPITLNMYLTPVFDYDQASNRVMAYFKEFPLASAIGEDENDAENNLIPVVELMWKERPDDVKKILLEMHPEKFNPKFTKAV